MKPFTSAKIAKLPPITSQTKILCFDLEANGLHGPVFAVGAVVMDRSGKVYDELTLRCPIEGDTDEWVKGNVLPAITGMPITHKSYIEIRQAFWAWYIKNEPKSDYILVANGYPVEYRFLIQCQEDNLDERYWQHPFPVLDLASMIVQSGKDGSKLANEVIKSGGFSRHNPLHDAKVSALMAFKVLNQ